MDKKFVRDQIEANSHPLVGKAYRPVNVRIGSEAKELYAAEEKRWYWLEKCADEWLAYLGFENTPATKWGRGIPQALYDALDSVDADAACAAAITFLQLRGYKVSDPDVG